MSSGLPIGALLAGFLAVIIPSLGTDIVLHAIGVFPRLGQPMSHALLLLATVYRTVAALPRSPLASFKKIPAAIAVLRRHFRFRG